MICLTIIQVCILCFVFVEKKKEPRIPTVSEMKIFCQVFLEQICRGGCGTAIGEYWGLQQSEIPQYIYSHPSVFSNSLESATFPTHLYQHSTLDDDSNCVETLSSKSGKSRSKFDSSLVTMALREELANDCNFQKMSSISCGEGLSRQFHVLKEGEQDEDHFFPNKNWEVRDIDGVLTSPCYHLRVEGTLFFNQLVLFLSMMMMMVRMMMRLRTMMT